MNESSRSGFTNERGRGEEEEREATLTITPAENITLPLKLVRKC